MNEITLPELGEGITSVEVSDILVNIGDKIKIDDPLIIVETDKASMEIPSDSNGSIKTIYVKTGDSIKPGDPILATSNTPKEQFDSHAIKENIAIENNIDILQREQNSIPTKPNTINTSFIPSDSSLGKPVLASPSIRRFARELGCDLNLVKGSGQKGRITKEDVQQYIKTFLNQKSKENSTLPLNEINLQLDFSNFGKTIVEPLSKIKQITGQRLQDSWQTIPHVTQFDKCEIDHLEKIRLKWKKDNSNPNIKPSLLPFFIMVVAKILKQMPYFNSSFDSNNKTLIMKQYFNIGIAVETDRGLIVPVIKNVLEKSILDIAKELTSLSKNARNKNIKPFDMQGSNFTISNLGGIGGTNFTPIINPPEVAILGISKAEKIPHLIKGELKEKLILPFSLSYDHRVIDGADAARFTSAFCNHISQIDKI